MDEPRRGDPNVTRVVLDCDEYDALTARIEAADALARQVGGHHYHTANGEHPNSPAHSADRVNANRCDVCATLTAYQNTASAQVKGDEHA